MTRATYSATPLLRSLVHRPHGVIPTGFMQKFSRNGIGHKKLTRNVYHLPVYSNFILTDERSNDYFAHSPKYSNFRGYSNCLD